MATVSSREENVYLAKLAEQAERYEEMIKLMENVKVEGRGNADNVSVIREYRAKIESELSNICAGILKLLDEKLVPAAGNGDFKILNSPDRVCSLAKQAFTEAITELDTLGEDSFKDSTLIMQLICDNLTLWTSDMQDDGTDEIKEAPKAEDELQQ
ncbi:Ribosomal protein S6e [Hibiscus syriacus]|uniref:Ribosomal protein S6e n=1 Tax=Hibiscus syriacus TaxID=106335 RepID=A0A6A3BCU3_HIBSY|nr:Ribosomal protein S6e [Hibiscus syriacus]